MQTVKFGLLAPGHIVSFDELHSYIKRAESIGIDGIFFFDHLWPHGHPEKPALDSLIASATVLNNSSTLFSGPIVLRVTARGVESSFSKLATLYKLYNARFLCSIGAGDKKSLPEDSFISATELTFENRIKALTELTERLKPNIPDLWLGGSGPLIQKLAHELDIGLNVWDKDIDFIKSISNAIKISWSGPFDSLTHSPITFLKSLVDLNVHWIIIGWPPDFKSLSDIISKTK